MFIKDKYNYLIILLISVIAFHFSHGLEKLNPTNINWLMSAYHDWGTHYLGWAFYRNDPWTFPLGQIQSYNYPLGTNIGFTDSIPLLALIFKPFSSILPEDFQYFGIWLFLCCFLTGYYSFKIFRLYNTNKIISFLCIIILMLNPVLLFRSFHPALCAQWLIIASFYYYLKNANVDNVREINRKQLILLLLSTLITPYLTAMIAGFNIILPLKHFLKRIISLKKSISYLIVSLVIILFVWMILGMIEFNNSTNLSSVESYNFFSFNLNSFFNSYGYFSKFFPDLGMTDPRQYEGFAYLGLGMMCMVLFSFFYLIVLLYKKKILLRTLKKYNLLFLLCIALFLFSATNEITFANKTILKFPLPTIIEKIGFIFRASGRFIWAFYYFIFIFSLLIFTKILINKRTKIIILVVVISFQFYDTQTLFNQWKYPSGSYTTKLSDEKWVSVMKNFNNVIVYPPFTYNYSMTYPMDYQDVCFNALKAGKPISNGYIARTNVIAAENFKTQLIEELKTGSIDSNRLFITTKDHLGDFKFVIKENIVDIQKMDNFIFIYKKNKLNPSNFESSPILIKYLDSIKAFYKNLKESEFVPIDLEFEDKGEISFYLDNFEFTKNIIKLRGWAFLKGTNNNKGDTIYISLTNKNNTVIMPLDVDKRADITEAYKKNYLDDSGFYTTINTSKLPKNQYTMGIFIKNKTGKYSYSKTDKVINVK